MPFAQLDGVARSTLARDIVAGQPPAPWHGPMIQQHVLDGTLMGDDAKRSVANGYGQTHDVANCSSWGPGFFRLGAVNPTFTIHALAVRSAGYIADNWHAFS